jgi:hypothetical protein
MRHDHAGTYGSMQGHRPSSGDCIDGAGFPRCAGADSGVFYQKAGAFVFDSGLAIIPFLQQGVVQQFGWLNEH